MQVNCTNPRSEVAAFLEIALAMIHAYLQRCSSVFSHKIEQFHSYYWMLPFVFHLKSVMLLSQPVQIVFKDVDISRKPTHAELQ
jgi:putative flippase GtrA